MKEYDERYYNKKGMTDSLQNGNANIGWKVRLNISPKDASVISKYLKKEGFCHKFIHGGEITDGRIFTIYIGSYTKTEKLSQKLSKDLKPFLRRPVCKKEIEFSPGIVGRFAASGIKTPMGELYRKGWSLGMPNDQDLQARYSEKTKKEEQGREQQNFQNLRMIFGDYFFLSKSREPHFRRVFIIHHN